MKFIYYIYVIIDEGRQATRLPPPRTHHHLRCPGILAASAVDTAAGRPAVASSSPKSVSPSVEAFRRICTLGAKATKQCFGGSGSRFRAFQYAVTYQTHHYPKLGRSSSKSTTSPNTSADPESAAGAPNSRKSGMPETMAG